MPDPVTGLIVGGSQLLGGALQAGAAEDAADAQSASAQKGIDEQRRQYDIMRELLKPYVEAGLPALQAQQALLGLGGPGAEAEQIGMIERSPGFNALVKQGENAMLQNASATGGLRGGNLQAALAQFRPQMLASELDRRYSRLGGMTALGQQSAAGVGTAGMQSASNIADLYGQQGAAIAGGELGRGRAISGLLNLPSQILGAQIGAGGKLGLGFSGIF